MCFGAAGRTRYLSSIVTLSCEAYVLLIISIETTTECSKEKVRKKVKQLYYIILIKKKRRKGLIELSGRSFLLAYE